MRIAKRTSVTVLQSALTRGLFGVACVGAFLAVEGVANAQIDVNPPLPNVLLLVDNSGSMEYMMGFDASGNPRYPTCHPTDPSQLNEQNRWTTLVTTLTGTIPSYTCEDEPRTGNTYKTEFGLNSQNPYDLNYYVDYHRPVSAGCVSAPNQAAWPASAASGGAYAFPTNSMSAHQVGNPSISCAGFTQNPDGLLDAFRDRVRFGMMTYDSFTDPGTGVTPPSAPDYTTGPKGMWSYFPNWWTGTGTVAAGHPDQCAASSPLEVGARNAAAPPWEGKMIAFGDPAALLPVVHTQNDEIQAALLALRPYGATPTAGLLTDAQYFLNTDTMADPVNKSATGQQLPFGPKDDPFIVGACRKTYIILLTDGAPNLDLRPSCAAGTGVCPYQTPEQIAYSLANQPNNPVETFVVGVALSTVGPVGPTQIDCKTFTQNDLTMPGGICATNPNPGVQACCSVSRIAYNGGTSHAYFADDPTSLRLALSNILSNIAGQSTSRTFPVFSTASVAPTSGSGSPAGFRFYSSFFVATGSLWSGVLERQRYVCTADPMTGITTAQAQTVATNAGDEFADNPGVGGGNINQPDSTHPRTFVTVIGPGSSTVNSKWTIRGAGPGASAEVMSPPMLGNDGLGAAGGTVTTPANATGFVTSVSPAVMNVIASGPPMSTCTDSITTYSPTACRDQILSWEVGLPPTGPKIYSRAGNVFGSIYHSTPTLVGPPNDFLRDESYTLFQGQQAHRPLVLYTATTDGQLHAFKVAASTATDAFSVSTGSQNNELWSFLPPAVLPGLQTLYPGVQQNLLDGAPVVRDIVLSRVKAQVDLATSQWSTVLAAGFGPSLGGYYALDVTKPVIDAATTGSGPQFLWQVSTDQAGVPLFGPSGNPAITSVYVIPPGQTAAQEVAVAILPGGDGPTVTGGVNGCTRQSVVSSPLHPITIDPLGRLRNSVNCYDPNEASRSVTIVRLDNGEVIRRFANPALTANSSLASCTTASPIDSPMVGTPVAYPAGPGQVSTRAFIGDKDGTMWRIDLSSSDPAQWYIAPFFDAFAKQNTPFVGQPIATTPLMSTDSLGNLVIVFSTGNQDLFTSGTSQNYAWSVREIPDITSNTIKSVADWHLGAGESLPFLPTGVSTTWTTGQRVAGPMSLFNGVVYFSSYLPPGGATVCDSGSSVLWGVDYLQSSVTGSADAGPVGRLMIDPSQPDPTKAPPAAAEANSLIFGVGIARTPPCFTDSTTTDPYLGNGSSVTTPGSIDSGGFQLVVQTGSKGGTTMTGGQTNVASFNLPPPPTSVRISSWAAVVE